MVLDKPLECGTIHCARFGGSRLLPPHQRPLCLHENVPVWPCYIAVYVDDLLIIVLTPALVVRIKSALKRSFKLPTFTRLRVWSCAYATAIITPVAANVV